MTRFLLGLLLGACAAGWLLAPSEVMVPKRHWLDAIAQRDSAYKDCDRTLKCDPRNWCRSCDNCLIPPAWTAVPERRAEAPQQSQPRKEER
jgi:hypothetical protein